MRTALCDTARHVPNNNAIHGDGVRQDGRRPILLAKENFPEAPGASPGIDRKIPQRAPGAFARVGPYPGFRGGELQLILEASVGVFPLLPNTTPVRLSPQDRGGIRFAVDAACAEANAVWKSIVLFGSRVDPDRKGGDIDLLVSLAPSSEVDAFRFTQRLRMKLEDQLGEQHVDIVIDDGRSMSPFLTLAKQQGVELWSRR